MHTLLSWYAQAYLCSNLAYTCGIWIKFCWSSHTCDLTIGTLVATLPGAWCQTVCARTGWLNVSTRWQGETENVISMIMTMIALKGATHLKHIRSSGLGAVVCKSRAAQNAYQVQHVVCHVVRRDSSAIKFDRVWITFICKIKTNLPLW